MPISSISTFFIHNHAPVLEIAAILKNAYKQHFVGVSAYLSTYPQGYPQAVYNLEKFFKISSYINQIIQFIRACALPVSHFLVNTIYYTSKSHLLHHYKHHFLNYPYYPNRYSIQYNYIDIQILLPLCNIL